MKIVEIIEAPISGIKQAAQGLGSRVLKKVPGMKSTAANLAGKADLAATANNLYREFMTYLGTQNKNAESANTQDVIDFLDGKNVDTSDIDQNAPMTPDRINKIFLAKSTQAMRGKGAKPAPTAQPSAAPAAKPSSAYSQTLGSAQKLSAKEKRRLIQQLQKGLPPTKVPPVPLGGRKTTP
jgi:hypothetical protein